MQEVNRWPGIEVPFFQLALIHIWLRRRYPLWLLQWCFPHAKNMDSSVGILNLVFRD